MRRHAVKTQSSSGRISHQHHVNNNEKSFPPDRDLEDDLPIPALPFPVAVVTIFTAAIVCFMNSYDAEFVFDDSEAITGNNDLKPDTPWTELFHNDFWGNKLASKTSHKSYRPLTVLTFRWNYYLAGGLHPMGFHVTNVLLHGLVSIVFVPVFNLLLGVKDHSFKTRGYMNKATFLSALLFAVHPIHTESVSGVVGRADLMCALTFLLAFLAYHRAIPRDVRACHLLWMTYSMVLCAVSVLFKEIGITVLGVCCAYDTFIVCGVDPLQVLGFRKNQTENKKHSCIPRSLLMRTVIILITGVVILASRWWIMGSSPPTFQVVDNPHSFVNSTILRVLNYNYLYCLNAWLLINPYWLCFDWSMGCVPVIETLLDPRLLAVLALWFVLGSLIRWSLLYAPNNGQWSVLMALSMLIVPFLPASNVLFRVGFVIAERVLYLPSAGFVLLVVLGFRKLHLCWPRKQVWNVLMAILLLTYGVRSYRRSHDWQNEQLLFESGDLVCPLNAKVQYNIAKIHADKGHTDYAIDKYRLAIKLNPLYDQAMNNLGNIFKDQGHLLEAEQLLLKATSIREEFAAAWMNLAIVQATLNQSENAERSYFTALKHRRKYPDCYYNLGNLYLSENKPAAALSAWRNATLQKPQHVSAWSNMIILLDNLGRYADMEVVVQEALRHNPEDSGIHYNYANALGKAGKYEQAENHFLTAIKSNPGISTYYSNLAVLYHRWGKMEKAEQWYQKALQLDPQSQQTKQNYDMLLKKLGKIS